jgi:hypothetical protein
MSNEFKWSPESVVQTLNDIGSRKHNAEWRDVRSELRLLKEQVEMALDCLDYGYLKTMTQEERNEHDAKFGKGSICVGSFIISKRL